nr:uncharacterized protein LOC113713336 [Coffea arabica]
MLEAVESSVNGFSHLQSCGDSSEEELSVLPRHTKVVVTGNNRTKSVLVGLQGVVKKAVGLGGWHWLISDSLLSLVQSIVKLKISLPRSIRMNDYATRSHRLRLGFTSTLLHLLVCLRLGFTSTLLHLLVRHTRLTIHELHTRSHRLQLRRAD